MIFVVTYRYDPGAGETITNLRPRHREFLAELHHEGMLLASGPWVGEEPGAYLLLATETAAEALAVLDDDPFAAAGVIAERSVQGWQPVIGALT